MSKAKSAKKQSKSDFIRSQPSTLSAAEVVEKGKVQGVKFDAFLVYKVRSRAGAKRKTIASNAPANTNVRARRATAARKGAPVPRPIATASKAEELLKALAAELGLGLAVKILEAERVRVRAAIGG
jgi:hypothetical protein